jgi:hypothetical protein
MPLLTRDDLGELLATRDGPCVSVYLPTQTSGAEVRQNPIRLKNLLKKAEGDLGAFGLAAAGRDALLEPARELLEEKRFWEHQSGGLALFLAPGFSRGYRLPVAFPEKVVVGQRFNVKPLLPLLAGDGRFYVLALSQNGVRLLEGSRHRVGHLDLEGVPADIAEALRFDDPEKSLQLHTTTSTGGGRRAAAFHGHGAVESTEKDNLARYFRQIDRGLVRFLEGERAPVVLAGVEHYFPIYREVSNYPHLLDGGVVGSPDHLTDETLHARAWEIVGPRFRRAQEDALSRYRQLAGTGRTSRQVEEVVSAAHHGKVDTLFVALGRQTWGRFEENGGGRVVLSESHGPGDLDLLDLAAAKALQNGGTVYALPPEEIPTQSSPIAAILRY